MRVLAYLALVVFFVGVAAWFTRKRAGGKGKARGKAGRPAAWRRGPGVLRNVPRAEKLVLRVDDDFLGGIAAAWSLSPGGYRVVLQQDVSSGREMVRRHGQDLAAAMLNMGLEPAEGMVDLRNRLLSMGVPVLSLVRETPSSGAGFGRTSLPAGSLSSRASAGELREALGRATRTRFAAGPARAETEHAGFDLKSEAV